ncbi:putative phosphoesterase [Bacillus mesophilus]|nr:putative phosphoesterase [Bacillus mesophilus]
MPKKSRELPTELIKELQNTDYTLHLGDWQNMDTYIQFKNFAPIDGVAGNLDDEGIINLFGFKKILEFHGIRIGLVHGHLGKGRSTEARALNSFTDEQVDIILFGHSHIPILKQVNAITLFNPGSPTDKRRQDAFSFGVINIAETLSIHHVFFENNR